MLSEKNKITKKNTNDRILRMRSWGLKINYSSVLTRG